MHIPTGCVHYISVWNVFLPNFFLVICLRRGNPTTKLSKCMSSWSCYFQNANVLVPQQWWGVTSMQRWVTHARGMTQIFLQVLDSDREMTEDGWWLIRWPGMDYLCKADWIPGSCWKQLDLSPSNGWSTSPNWLYFQHSTLNVGDGQIWSLYAGGSGPSVRALYITIMRGKKNGRDAFQLRTGGHSWLVMMHQHNIRTISVNTCKLEVGLLLIHWNKS